MRTLTLAALLAATTVALADPKSLISYPAAKKADQSDTFFGVRITDPYRWLEDADAPDTRAWIDAENALTHRYLDTIPERATLKKRLTDLWNYERYGVPSKEGPWYVFSRNTGLQKQSVVYKTQRLDATPEVLIDPNEWSPDGTVALSGLSFTDDGKHVAYAKAVSGSDWKEWRVRDVASGQDLPDVVKWAKFSGATWLKDGSGFFYSRYDAPKGGDLLQAVNKNQKVYLHKLGTPQEQDVLAYERPDQPDWGFGAEVTDDGRFLLLYQTEGCDNRNRVFVRDLRDPNGKIRPFLDAFDAAYSVVGNDGDVFFVLTNNQAPRYRLVAIDRMSPATSFWRTLVPEAPGRDVLNGASMVNEQFVTTWMTDAHTAIRLYGKDGAKLKDVALPGLGTASGFSGRRGHKEGFYSFTSYTDPATIFRYDFATGASTVFRKPSVPFDAARYETVQVFYPSKDGTKIPLFLTCRKGLARSGQNPTYLYGYGGFNAALTPTFSPAMAAWLELGGVYAVANLRGGGEYGQAWYDAGRLKNKQNVFDDFIAAAEFLIRERYTSTPKLAIAGGSNGGLLVGACVTQRPELFGAALPAVGVMDLLRYHKFTIGWAWKSDYGDPDTKEGFDSNIRYSPLHNVKPGTKYPATFLTTADHDDRVVPAHSFKFAAALQAAQAGAAPVLIRIETKAGHGAGKSTEKQIEERADAFSFLVRELGITLPEPLAASHAAGAAAPSARGPARLAAADTPRFSLNDPAGPQFTEAQKAAQVEAGATVLPLVLAAFSNGLDTVRIPPGDYRFGKERWGRDGAEHALTFRGLRRDSAHPFTIDAAGATFWFDLPDDQAPQAHFALGFRECSNLIFRGATLDRGTRGHVEGRITEIDFANNRIEIQLSPGLAVPATFNGKLEQRVLPFKADGRFCAPLYALQKGGVHLKYKDITPSGAAGRYFVNLGDRALLSAVSDVRWRERYGGLGTLEAGDGLSCVYAVSCSVELIRCEHLTMEGLKVYIPKGWGAEWGGAGGHVWKDCTFGPRPGTSQWQGGEGFMFCATRRGATLDGVVMRHTADDLANFHGYWGHVERLVGSRVTFVRSGEFDRTLARDLAPGDRLLFRDRNSGAPLGEARVVSAEGSAVLADRPVEAFTNALVQFPDHECAGWKVQRCDFRDNYQRLLIQSGPGVIADSVFARQGSAVEINSDFPYVEGGVACDIMITGNTFEDVNPQPGGAAIWMHTHTDSGGSPTFSNIVITGNAFIRPGAAAIRLNDYQGGFIVSNRFEQTATPPVELTRCAGLHVADNTRVGERKPALEQR